MVVMAFLAKVVLPTPACPANKIKWAVMVVSINSALFVNQLCCCFVYRNVNGGFESCSIGQTTISDFMVMDMVNANKFILAFNFDFKRHKGQIQPRRWSSIHQSICSFDVRPIIKPSPRVLMQFWWRVRWGNAHALNKISVGFQGQRFLDR